MDIPGAMSRRGIGIVEWPRKVHWAQAGVTVHQESKIDDANDEAWPAS